MTSVRLTTMTEAEFDEFYEGDIRHYAEENTASGRWTVDEAEGLSRKAHEELLPQGLATKNHFLFAARDGMGEYVGVVWLTLIDHIRAKEAFIYDIEVAEKRRGHGLGPLILRAAEKKAWELGAGVASLHVFCHNKRAFTMYRKAGYKVVSVNMSKALPNSD